MKILQTKTASPSFIKQQISGLKKNFDQKFIKINQRFDDLDKNLDKKIEKKFKEQTRVLLDSNLEIVKELKVMREEMSAFAYRQARHSDQLENHEQRVSVLEQNCALNF